MEKYLAAEDTNKPALMEEASGIKAACSDPKVFNQLYLAHVRPIFRYIFSKVGNVRQTEDLTSQVFLAALESLPHYHHEGRFSAWLFSIARHKITDYYRTQHRESSIEATNNISYNKGDPLSTVIQTQEAQLWIGARQPRCIILIRFLYRQITRKVALYALIG